ncbi:prolyl oligopeptidase family serine peptidase [Tengunoibacter tsumagoiensis]|uniref:Hydrolase n=1 Tax=Tengunoibacter tsumagoiensis TaxID=2014871 RepID=A0A402A6D1_9CHLR|nr:prolyl oligopeptidase family serine peptidase [Tengunoibacter tsumagoiensis]GCE14575.1 hydrolase [Tengunoibacter tsumagoiensis]
MSSEQQEGLFECQITRRLPYLLTLPAGYTSEQRYPLVLFLHGAGERGNDVNKLKIHGLPREIEEGQSFPFITVAPQCPAGSWWTVELEALTALLNFIEETYAVDPDRIYLTGMSMGGMGTWALSMALPERFAALLPICGGNNPDTVDRIKHIPVWAFHGAKDDVVPLEASTKMVEALRAAGGNVKFTIYPEADHDSWTETYKNPAIYSWLLAQKRSRL